MLSRADLRRLKRAVRRKSDAAAAEALLADSVKKGHDKLALHRYLALHRIDASRCVPYESYCRQVAAQLPADVVHRVLRHSGWID